MGWETPRTAARAALPLALLFSALFPDAHAHAQAATAHVAEALFDEGRKLMAMERYEEACSKFGASQRLDPAVGTLLNLGYCWKQVGKAASAWTAYREAASLAHWQRQREREVFARAEAAALESRLARLSIHVAGGNVAGLELRRNGVVVPRDVWGIDVPVDPGEYTIEALAPDRARFATRVTVQPAARAAVTVPVLRPVADGAGRSAGRTGADASAHEAEPLRGPEPRSTLTTVAEPERSDRGGALSALSIGAGSVGLVALGVSAFFAVRMQAQDEQARAICRRPDEPCSQRDVQRHEQLKRSARDSRAVAYASAGAGAAFVIGALVLHLVVPSDAGAASTRARVRGLALGLSPGELTIGAHGAF